MNFNKAKFRRQIDDCIASCNDFPNVKCGNMAAGPDVNFIFYDAMIRHAVKYRAALVACGISENMTPDGRVKIENQIRLIDEYLQFAMGMRRGVMNARITNLFKRVDRRNNINPIHLYLGAGAQNMHKLREALLDLPESDRGDILEDILLDGGRRMRDFTSSDPFATIDLK